MGQQSEQPFLTPLENLLDEVIALRLDFLHRQVLHALAWCKSCARAVAEFTLTEYVVAIYASRRLFHTKRFLSVSILLADFGTM